MELFVLIGGVLFVGLWIVAIMDAARHTKCPHCRGKIERGASVCRHCGRDVRPPGEGAR